MASRLLRELAHSTYVPPGSYCIAWPSPEVADRRNTDLEWLQLKDVAVHVFHKVCCRSLRPYPSQMHGRCALTHVTERLQENRQNLLHGFHR